MKTGLACVFAGTPGLMLSESPIPSVWVRCKRGRSVLLTYHLAPWGRDDWIEYLLTEHRDRCASVMGRLPRGAAPDPLGGCPFLWRIILDYMAAPPGGGPFSIDVKLDPALIPKVKGLTVTTAPIPVFRRGQWKAYTGP